MKKDINMKKDKLLSIIQSNIYFGEITKDEVMAVVNKALKDRKKDEITDRFFLV